MNTLNRSLYFKWLKVAAIVSIYWLVSISMLFFNRYLLSSEDLKLDAPVFITASQCFIGFALLIILEILGKLFPDYISVSINFNLTTAKKVAPLSLIFVAMITFNNLALKGLGVAFYTVGRSLTTVFNVILVFLILRQRISWRVLICCAVIVFGFWFGTKEENKSTADFAFLDLMFCVLASFFVALYAVFVKKTLPLVDDNLWRLQFYNNLNGCIFLLPVITVLREWAVLAHFEHWNSPPFWLLLVTVGILGISIGYVSSLQIQATSPLTHNISGTAKACTQTVLACAYYSLHKTAWWWLCNFMVLTGSLAYTVISMKEMKKQVTKKSLTPADQNDS